MRYGLSSAHPYEKPSKGQAEAKEAQEIKTVQFDAPKSKALPNAVVETPKEK